MNKTMNSVFRLVGLCALLVGTALAQFQGPQTLTTTTLANVVNDTKSNLVQLASTTSVTCCVNRQTLLYVDAEAMLVTALPGSPFVTVQRGFQGTHSTTHASGATVYVGPPNLFTAYDPSGTCTLAPTGGPPPTPPTSTAVVFPFINLRNARRWNCINITGQTGLLGTWMVDNGLIVLGPGSCGTGTSGNLTAAGPTVVGASFTGVQQVSTTGTGTNTHYYSCNLNNILSSLAASPPKNVAVLDATFYYGVQTTGLGTQAAVLASGTQNAITVFSKIAFPVAGAAETPSTVTPVRADAGTLLITPVVASYNVATTTAGAFYSAKYTPASAIPLTTDGTEVFFNVALLNTATSATITNSPGVTVHYAYVPENVGVQF